ncbi:hypothetical protein [Frigoriglobus tundricola]|uniref:Uncharacterized protein n=1 Tax=Frigoriglobus tundricola TaxID=2774151 RepID=A0A6M5YW69_9BACT|nr:hypothetical protein [Frigoriglobus tundricola]QJW98178.1 hypothetical protein FTUN_5758 [Frigoriglobus tundricola]
MAENTRGRKWSLLVWFVAAASFIALGTGAAREWMKARKEKDDRLVREQQSDPLHAWPSAPFHKRVSPYCDRGRAYRRNLDDEIPPPHAATSFATSRPLAPTADIPIYTAVLKPSGRLLARLRENTAAHVSEGAFPLELHLEGVVLPEFPTMRARVYILQPGAPLPTSTDHKGYIGYVTLGSSEDSGKPCDYIWDLAPVVSRLSGTKWFDPNQFSIGVVGFGADGEPLNTPVVFERLTLTSSESDAAPTAAPFGP